MVGIITTKKLVIMAKKGVYRRLEKVEILKDTSVFKKGEVREMHPVLAARIIAEDVGKKTTKEVNVVSKIPVGNIKS
jgi:hypothetical protein